MASDSMSPVKTEDSERETEAADFLEVVHSSPGSNENEEQHLCVEIGNGNEDNGDSIQLGDGDSINQQSTDSVTGIRGEIDIENNPAFGYSKPSPVVVARGGRPKERAWAHFTVSIRSSKAICKHCSASVSARHERLRAHLETHHPESVGQHRDTANAPADNEFEMDDSSDVGNSHSHFGADMDIKSGSTDETELNLTAVWNSFKVLKSVGRTEARCYKCNYTSKSPTALRLTEHLKKHSRNVFRRSAGLERNQRLEVKRRDIHSFDKCLFCQGAISQSYQTKKFFQAWEANCAKSMCRLFGLDTSFETYFEGSKFCSSCRQTMFNIDFTLTALKNLKACLDKDRDLIENLLRDNYEKIVDSLDTYCPKILSDNQSYDNSVKAIYEALSISENEQEIPAAVRRETHKQSSSSFSKYGREISYTNLGGDRDSEEGNGDKDSDFVPDGAEAESGALSDSETSLDASPNTSRCVRTKVSPHSPRGRKPVYTKKQKRTKTSVLHPPSKANRLYCEVTDCTLSFYKQKWLDIHVRSVHEGDKTPYHCDQCPQKFRSTTCFRYHYRRHGPEPKYTCKTCKKLFFEKYSLNKHLTRNPTCNPDDSNTRSEKCMYCAKTCGPETWEQHEELHIAMGAKGSPFDCVLCERLFTNSTDLKHHVRLEHEGLPKCTQCGRVFNSEKNLQKHMEYLHSDRNPSFKCPDCPYVGINKSDHLRHLQTHRVQRDHCCHFCGNTYKNNNNLKLHLMIHTGESPFRCKLCPKAFNQSCKLKAHEEIHNETKNYTCDKCGKAFRTAKNVSQHTRYYCKEGPKLPYSTSQKRRAGHQRKSLKGTGQRRSLSLFDVGPSHSRDVQRVDPGDIVEEVEYNPVSYEGSVHPERNAQHAYQHHAHTHPGLPNLSPNTGLMTGVGAYFIHIP